MRATTWCILLLASLVKAQNNSTNGCAKGTFQSGLQCLRCPPGTYSDVKGATECKRCPSGRGTSSFASKALRDCSICREGLYEENGICEHCPRNTYSDKRGATKCLPCPQGKVSGAGSNSIQSCTTCNSGFAIAEPGSFRACALCPPGKTTTSENASKCEDCPPGTFQSNSRHIPFFDRGLCQPCRPGTFSAQGSTSCKLCPIGFYQTDIRASSCKKCPKGSTTAVAGKMSCRPTCLPSDPGCIWCPPGEGFNSENKKCERCPPGFISPTASSTECYACQGEGKANELRTKCTCEPGYRVTKDGMCDTCPLRYTSDGATCICPTTGLRTGLCQCAPGEKFNFQRRKCVKGETQDPFECREDSVLEAGECKKCPGDSVPDKTKTICTCDSGKGIRKRKCTLCPPGEFIDEDMHNSPPAVVCRKCHQGEFSDKAGSKSCKRCPKGRQPRKTGATSCLPPCPPGAERQAFGNNERCFCKEGHAAQGKDPELTCIKCKENEIVFRGKCVCPSEMFAEARKSNCLKCPKNSYLATYRGKCICNDGFGFNKKTGKCEICPRGTSTGDIGTCEPCPPGLVTFREGQRSCMSCSPGFEPFQGARCLPACVDGYFRNEDGSCDTCAPGQRLVGLKCEECPDNAVSKGGDKKKCTRCQGGKMPNEERDECV